MGMVSTYWPEPHELSASELRTLDVLARMAADLMEGRRLVEKQGESEERFRLAIKATNDAIWDIDLETGIVTWNETYSALYGRPAETSDSWQWWIDRIYPEDRERTVSGLRASRGRQQVGLYLRPRIHCAQCVWQSLACDRCHCRI